MPPEDAAPTPPPIPDYELLRRVGRGSYGDVWLARSATGLFRAVKIVWLDRFNDEGPYEREFSGLREFARFTAGETRQMSLLHVGRNNRAGFFYYVMELADDVVTGRNIDPACYAPLTFKAIRDADTFLPAVRVVSYAIELTRDLVELHENGLIHRDIKPSNIIIVDGRPKLADIGLVALASEAVTFVGTEGFVPPEGPGTTTADIYSFGKVLYELATGRDRHDFPRLPTDLGERADRREFMELNEIIIKASAPSSEDRYTSAEAMLGELQLLEAGRSVRRLRFAEAGLMRARKWLIIAASIATVAGIGAFIERNRANTESAGRRAAEAELAAVTRRSLYESSIARTQRALETGDFGRARAALVLGMPAEGDPDLRGFEWFALAREAEGDPAVVLRTAGPRVTDLVFSPDGALVAVDDTSTTIELYDTASGQLIRKLPHIHRVKGFTPDGKRLVGTTPTYELETWSVEDGSPDPRPNEPGIHRPLGVARTKPELLYFTDSRDDTPHRLAIRDLVTDQDIVSWPIPRVEGELTWEFFTAEHDADLTTALMLLVHSRRNFARIKTQLFDLRSGTPLQTYVDTKHKPVAVSPAGDKYLSEEVVSAALTVRSAASHETLWHSDAASWADDGAVFSPDGSLIAVAIFEKILQIRDARTGELRHTLTGQNDIPDCIAWGPDNNMLASGSRQGDVRLWSLNHTADRPLRAQLGPGRYKPKSTIVYEHDGDRMLFSGDPNAAEIVKADTLAVVGHIGDVANPIWFENGRLWWINLHQQLVTAPVADPSDPTVVPIIEPTERINDAAISLDGQWVAVSTETNTVHLWNRTTQTKAGVYRSPVGISSVGVHNNGTVVLIDHDQLIQLRDLPKNQLLRSRQVDWRVDKFRFSPDGQWLLAIGTTPGTTVLRVDDLSNAMQLDNTFNSLSGFSFSPDGLTLACSGTNSTVLLYSTSDWHERPSLTTMPAGAPHAALPVDELSFSPDGDMLATRNTQGDVRVWRW
ncbi:serine/threonine-protein kinase [Synoicihabitans lomoniglobus]|uniref:Serine/threonine-protein kinase n=1 Tax=Synoicihabitans lomoniglobus TaxID=2909285 RepID=A0AAE9ZV22_9BACT|nr:serine/threonine-protein kinase [Opitutaceae bacterium LMO-M01]WED64632.1 serine/threonine-protein kinase [Opitutaceae bacterium LMO-M01]